MVNFNENAIREAAYYNWQNAGCPQGQDEKFWMMAIEQLSSSSSCSKSSCSKSSSSKSSSTKSCASKSASCKSASAKKAAAPKKSAK